jgi:adenylate cyclase
MAEANADAPEDRRIVLRVGINLGDVMVEGSDLYGDGVNIAARIEGLAGPGEIWIAASVHDQIENKASGLSFEDLGPREMKNLARPVRVLRVVTGLPAEKQLAGKPLPSAQPSIAVLPFTNMSGDPGQDFITDGITENIIADLSRFRDLAVISRQSTFAYKGKAVKVQEVSRELGARYILEGSLQKPGERVRITAQLIDGATGQHLWTERYSRKVDDIFAMLDEVTETIVVTLAAGYGGRLHKAWRTRAGKSGQRTFEAYDYFSRGVEIAEAFTKEANNEARKHFAKAIELDPAFAKALAKLAWSYTLEVVFGWGDNPADSWANALKFAKLAVERDDDEAWGHWALAGYYRFQGQTDRAMQEYRRAIELNPNDADVLADFAYCLSYGGKPEEGLASVHRAMRLNPHCPDWYVEGLALVYRDSRKYEEAIAAMEKLRGVPTVPGYLYLAARRKSKRAIFSQAQLSDGPPSWSPRAAQ